MNLKLHFGRPGAVGAIFLTLTLAVSWLRAADEPEKPQIPANELVTRAVQKQLNDNGLKAHFMYRLHRQTPERDETREVLETGEGSVARLIMTGGKLLAPEQQKVEEQRLNRYLDNPSTWQQRRKRQNEDTDRSNQLLAALPKAFLYSYSGSEVGPNGEQWLRLSFEPNPSYVAPNRDLRVFEGMKGEMWLDPAADRIIRLQANLFRDVDFGWGILGRLYHGGNFEIVQREIGDHRWEVTKTTLHFEGKALMLKSLHIQETETLTDFHSVPEKLTLSDGIHMLEQYDPQQDMVAQRQASRPAMGGGTPPK